MGAVEKLRNLASLMTVRREFASIFGTTFGGKRDLYETLGYTRILKIQDYRLRFRRNAVAGRVIEAHPKATWRGGGEIIEDLDPNTETTFEKAWDDFAKRLKIWRIFARADMLGGFGQHSTILIGAPGALNTPLNSVKSPDDIAYLKPYMQDRLSIKELDTDPTSPRFGLPDMYLLRGTPREFSLVQEPVPLTVGMTDVHWSRCLHVCDDLEDAIYGLPRLERVWNLLDDLEKVTGGGAEAFWMRANPGYQFDLDKEIELTPEKEKELEEQVDKLVHNMQRVVRTRGVKVETLGSDVANFANPAASIIAQISAGTGIPQRILMGSERGELASTQDRDNWFDQIVDRRDQFAVPNVINPFVDRLIEIGALPKPKQYQVRWSQLKSLDDGQKADLGIKYATVNKYQGETVITSDEIRDKCYGLPPLSAEEKAAELEKMKLKKPALPIPGQPVPGPTPVPGPILKKVPAA